MFLVFASQILQILLPPGFGLLSAFKAVPPCVNTSSVRAFEVYVEKKQERGADASVAFLSPV